MQRIERDPHLEVCPDFASDHYENFRALIVNAGATEEEAVAQLTNAWQQENEVKKAAWNAQVEEDQQLLLAAEQQARQIQQEEQEAARREKEKKRPKLNDFQVDSVIGNFIEPRPSTYALNKLENFEYVELFYFTLEGCLDAQSNHRTEVDDTYGLSRVGDLVSLRSISAVRASKNVIQDTDLSWNQMTYAKAGYLQHLEKAGWPAKHIDALAHFFIGIETSSFRARTHGEKVLITYQARVRRHWHDQLKSETGNAFNIAVISNGLLESISNEIWDKVHAKREVSFLNVSFEIQQS